MEKYPNFYFKSSRLAKKTGISPQKVSKLLLDLHRDGLLYRIDVGKSRVTPYYRVKL
jgi:Mn-dependent DtxR family transcriptional regulator